MGENGTQLSGPTVRSVGRDALLYVPGRIIPAVVQILTVPLLTYFFTRSEIGRYELASRFVLFLSTFTFLWLNMGILRFYAAHAGTATEKSFFGVMGFMKYAAVAVGLLLGLLAYLAGPNALFGSYRDLLLAGLVVFTAYSFYETGLAVLRAKRKPIVYSLATTLSAGLRLPLALALFMWWKSDIRGMLWAIAIMYFAAYVIVVQRHVGAPTLRFERTEKDLLREVLRYGLPIWLTQLLNFLITSGDRYLLKVLQNDAEVGLFAVANNLVDQPMALVFQTLTLAIFPSVAAAWELNGRDATEHLVGGVTRIFFLLCVPLMVFLGVMAHPLFAVLARGESFEAYRAAPWIAAASFFYGLSYFANFGLHLSKRTRWLLLMTIPALAANVAGNVLLAPRYGFVGAGMARLISNVVLVAGLAATGHRYLRWRLPLGSLGKILVSAVISGAAVFGLIHLLPENLLTLALLGGLGGISYLALLLLLRELRMQDLREMLRTLRHPG